MRRIQVEEFWPVGSLIRLKGKWLESAGFKPGALVTVASPRDGVIELRVVDDENAKLLRRQTLFDGAP